MSLLHRNARLELPVAAFLAVAALLTVACSGTTEPEPPNGFWSSTGTWAGRVVFTEDPSAPQWPADPVTIHTVVVRNDSLELTVSFGGGCRDHAFTLLADAAWAESYPVQIGMRLAHDANGDPCEALLSRILRFDLSPVKVAYESTPTYSSRTGLVRLNIQGGFSVNYSW